MSENLSTDRIAIVLFNLGGPDSLKSVKSFLFNLFYDQAIINLPNPLRFLIAKFISLTRNKKSQKIYSLIGNKSTILEETEKQKQVLTKKLEQVLGKDFKVFIAMRYFSPTSLDAIKEIEQYKPSEIILLPLYPQFSSTTTGSSIKEFMSSICHSELGLESSIKRRTLREILSQAQNDTKKTQDNRRSCNIPIKAICCYPYQKDFIRSHISLIEQSLKKLENRQKFRILFSAHGLPLKIIERGDPYRWQIEQTVKNIVVDLNQEKLDYKITYQSRVGPVEWLKPSTEEEIEIAGQEGKSLIIVPISFVSEHVETLVELDIEYRQIASKYKIQYIRVPALGVQDAFINCLEKMVLAIVDGNEYGQENKIVSSMNERICPSNFSMCMCNKELKSLWSKE